MRRTLIQQIFDPGVYKALFPQLVQALGNTILIAAISIVCGFALGLLVSLSRKKRGPLRLIGEAYVWLFRCTPLLVQALYVYFVMPELLHIDLSSEVCGAIVLSLISGAYMSSVISDALDSIPEGQSEAGQALGLSNKQIFLNIIFPAAFQNMLPSLFNQFIVCVKDTAVLSVINVNELTHIAKIYASLTYKNIASYTLLAIFYWGIINLLLLLQKLLESSFRNRQEQKGLHVETKTERTPAIVRAS